MVSVNSNNISAMWAILLGAIYGFLFGLIVFSYLAIALKMSTDILFSCLFVGLLSGAVIASAIWLYFNKFRRN